MRFRWHRPALYAEHLKYCNRRILPLLAMCISASFIHGFLPDSMLSVVLVPVIKDKCRKINDSDNYRPIALASVISKVVEKILLNRMSNLLTTTSNQFGFKSWVLTHVYRPMLSKKLSKIIEA